MPFGLHLPELIIVLVVALLIFGPKKLPEMGSAIGKSIKEFRKGMHELSSPEPKNGELRAPVKETIHDPTMPISQADLDSLKSTAYTGEEVSTNKPND